MAAAPAEMFLCNEEEPLQKFRVPLHVDKHIKDGLDIAIPRGSGKGLGLDALLRHRPDLWAG